MPEPITIVAYDFEWPSRFATAARHIRDALGDRVMELEHVGSTAVPGLDAKPVIDILLVVADSGDEPAYLPSLEGAGFRLKIREPDWYEHRLFNGPDLPLNLHVFSTGCPEIARMLRFRDWLRVTPGDRARYAETKRRLAAREWTSVDDYATAKTAIVRELIERAERGG